MSNKDWLAPELTWRLLYTKPHSEAWAEINLRNQGFVTLLPRVASRSGFPPLFPRYLFVGHLGEATPRSFRSTLGVLYVVNCGDSPTRVPREVIAEVAGRMSDEGVVRLPARSVQNRLFAKRERERVHALITLAAAGFRVRSA